VFAGSLGIMLGLIAGYVGGAVDGLIMRIADVQLTFPAILIALLINGVVKSVFGNRLDAMSTLAVAGICDRIEFLGAICAPPCAAPSWWRRTRITSAAAQLIGPSRASDHAASRAAERNGAESW